MNIKQKDKTINVKIRRFNPEKCEKFYYEEFKVPFKNGMSVLGVLNYIYENLDSSLSFYSSCRIGKCQGCHIKINGKIKIACTTIVKGDLILEPIKDSKVIKDLFVERD
jgi:succinate dehydrogenase/fumarate reductase iron-sulfur protein